MRAFSPEEVGREWHGLSLPVSSAHTHVNVAGPRLAPEQPHTKGGQVAALAAWGVVSSVTRKVVSMLKTVIMIQHTQWG